MSLTTVEMANKLTNVAKTGWLKLDALEMEAQAV